MRQSSRLSVAVAAAAALLGAVAPAASAHEVLPTQEPGVPVDATYLSSDNVEFVARFPEHVGTAGGRLLGDRFYVTDPRSVSIYDVSDPAAPTLLGSTPLFMTGTMAALGQEDPDTNGRILLVDGINPNLPSASASLQVVDVSDPTAPHIVGAVPVTDHTWTCVLDCTYAYGRTGHVVDLRDPANPVRTAVNWRDAIEVGSGPYTHDFTEVAPGLLMSAGQPSFLIDVSDPEQPVELARIESNFSTLGYHGAQWAGGATDDLLVVGTEIGAAGGTAGGDCQGDGVIRTYRASEVSAELAARDGAASGPVDATFELLDTWRATNGLPTDGSKPVGTVYCSHWFDLHPAFDGAGLMAVGYYDWGTRFLEVAVDGTMQEVGWFLPAEGSTSAAYWIDEEIVYSLDYRRGLEVLRFTGAPAGDAPVAGTAEPSPDATTVPAGATAGAAAVSTLPATGGSAAAFALGMVGVAIGLRRREHRGAVGVA